MSGEQEDRVCANFLARAESCLRHVRLAKFGSGSCNYIVRDAGGCELDIKILVTCDKRIPPALVVAEPPTKRRWWQP